MVYVVVEECMVLCCGIGMHGLYRGIGMHGLCRGMGMYGVCRGI